LHVGVGVGEDVTAGEVEQGSFDEAGKEESGEGDSSYEKRKDETSRRR
jgi:hypothetical protein